MVLMLIKDCKPSVHMFCGSGGYYGFHVAPLALRTPSPPVVRLAGTSMVFTPSR